MTDLAPVFGTPPEVRGGSVARAVWERVRFGFGVGEAASFGLGAVIPLGRTPTGFDSTVCPNAGNAMANVQRHSIQSRDNFMGGQLPIKSLLAQVHPDAGSGRPYLAPRSINSISYPSGASMKAMASPPGLR
jgi:hypothetical protein